MSSRALWTPAVAGLRTRVRRPAWPTRPVAVTAASLLLLALAVGVRLRLLRTGFWVDDGIAVGIASHPLRAIPAVLRQDGSPPLYYVLLHLWLGVFGPSARAAYALSLVFAVACVPVAWWGGRSLFDERTAWVCAGVAALAPFLTTYSGQARMYTLVALLALIAAITHVHLFLRGDRRALAPFAIALAALLYTHGWGLFFGVGAVAALGPSWLLSAPGPARRRLVRHALVSFGLAGLAFAPWLPTLAYQAGHTAAPWSTAPVRAELLRMSAYVAGAALLSPLMLAVVVGWVRERRAGRSAAQEHALVLLAILVVSLAVGWEAARLTQTWASRYTAIGVGPALLLVGAGLARAGWTGVTCAALTALTWLPQPARGAISDKSNVAQILARARLHAGGGDLVIATQPELVPVLRFYLGPADRYASTLGPTPDAQVMDWRDVEQRLRRTRAAALTPLLDHVPPGGRVVVVAPTGPPPPVAWQRLIHLRTRQWLRVLRDDPRFAVVFRTARGHDEARLNGVALLVARRRG